MFFVKRGSGVWSYRKWAVKLCGKGGGREPGRCAGSGCGRREAARVRKSPLTVERKNKKRRGICHGWIRQYSEIITSVALQWIEKGFDYITVEAFFYA